MNAVTGRCPDTAPPVNPKAVEQAIRTFGENFAACQRCAVLRDIVPADMCRTVRIMRATGIGNTR